MTALQNKHYFALWAAARRAQPDLVDRKELHAELGLPESHLSFSNVDLDHWKSRCLAIADPSDFKAQLAGVRMPATRRRHSIGLLAAALGVGENYINGTVKKMLPAQPFATIDTLEEDDLQRLFIAFKMHCRRQWKTKPILLDVVEEFCRDHDVADLESIAAAALNLEYRPEIRRLPYYDLLIVYGTLQQSARGAEMRQLQEQSA